MRARTARPALLVAVVAATASILLAGCAAAGGATSRTGSTADPTAAPVEFRNCGVDESIDAAPERVITIKSTQTELLLALGLGDRIVGTAFQDGPVPAEWAPDESAPVISDAMPSPESVLELEPDLVMSGWESAFAPDAAGDRAELDALGIDTWVSPAACRSADVPPPLTFDAVFDEIDQVGAIFRVDTAPLVDEQRAAVDAIVPDDRGLSALWYSSGTDTPYVGAGTGAPQLVLDTVGLDNIAGDIDQTWSTFGWEAVVDADPDVIVLIDADWNTADSKIALLESNPATAKLAAVREHRYLILPFAAGEAGVRTADAAVSIAEQLAGLDLP